MQAQGSQYNEEDGKERKLRHTKQVNLVQK